MIEKVIYQIIEQYPGLSEKIEFRRINTGYINDTFRILDLISNKKYILQRINSNIFADADSLMKNIDLITGQIQTELDKKPDAIKYRNYKYLYSHNGANYIEIEDKSKWRICEFIDNYPPDLSNKEKIAVEAGKILAYFHVLTSGVNIDDMVETIPDFHNLKFRWHELENAVGLKNERFRDTGDIYKEILDNKYLIDKFVQLINKGNIPLKVVHNDPKIDNILFDENGEALCFIDLDTAMPGYRPVDFGDAIRSFCNTAGESEKDLNKVQFEMDAFKLFTSSYLKNVESIFTDDEKSNLIFFPLFITYEQAIRFYTDYLNGDKYYKTEFPGQNLIRAKVQLKLLDSMQSRFDEMKLVVESIRFT